eukprot:ANDGO_04850.mRNA.1 Protein phosphatase 1 regulatory subunit 37 homolog
MSAENYEDESSSPSGGEAVRSHSRSQSRSPSRVQSRSPSRTQSGIDVFESHHNTSAYSDSADGTSQMFAARNSTPGMGAYEADIQSAYAQVASSLSEEESRYNPLRNIRRKEIKMRYMAKMQQSDLAKRRAEAELAHFDYNDFVHTESEAKNKALAALHDSQATENRSSYFVPSLTDLCARTIGFGFAKNPTFGELDDALIARVVPYISTDVPVPAAAAVIEDERYWKKCALAKYSVGELGTFHGLSIDRKHPVSMPQVNGSFYEKKPSDAVTTTTTGAVQLTYKQIFLEKEVQGMLERDLPIDPSLMLVQLKKIAPVLAPFVRRLTLRQLRSHVSLPALFNLFPNITEFSVSYGIRTQGMGFEMNMLGMRQSDASYIAEILKTVRGLKILRLSECMMDDILLRGILSGLVKNTTLEILDISHNIVGDNGAQAMATLLASNTSLKELYMSNNSFTSVSGQLFGLALRKNTSLRVVDLRLNHLQKEGGQMLCEGLRENHTLERLVISSNELTGDCMTAVYRAATGFANLVTQSTSASPLPTHSSLNLRSTGRETPLLVDRKDSGVKPLLKEEPARKIAIRYLDISDNPLGRESGEVVLAILRDNPNLHGLDIRMTGIDERTVQEVEEIVRKRNFESKYSHTIKG